MRCCLPLYTIRATYISARTTAPTRPDKVPPIWNQMAAETANSTAAASTVLGPPKRFKNGTSARHPAAAPSRSKKYTRPTRSIDSETAMDTTAPEKKKGSALAKKTSAKVALEG